MQSLSIATIIYLDYLCILPTEVNCPAKVADSQNSKEVSSLKLVSLAICSLGVWVVLNSFLGAASIWEDIVFGAIAAVLAFIGMFRIKD